MWGLDTIIAMNNKSQQDYQLKRKSKIDTFIAALSPEELNVVLDKVIARQYHNILEEEAVKKTAKTTATPGFVPTYDEIRNWYGYGKTKGEGKVFIAVEAQQKLYRYLMETCPHALGDFRDSDRACTQYARHACGQCMEEIARIIEI